MSEPMSAVEIEDVLSSIRRLVSDDLRPGARPVGAAGDADAAGKLILTPALRVVQDAPRSPDSFPEAAIEAVVAGFGAAVDAQAEEWESETGDLAPEYVEPPQWDVADVPDLEADAGDADFDGEDAELADADLDEDALDEVLAAEVLAFTPLQFHAHPRVTHDAPAAADPAPQDVPGWAQEGEEDAPQPARWSTATLEPDAAWADEAEAQVLEELSDAVSSAVPLTAVEEALEDSGYDPAAYDDEALRELVRELIVEELQGPLGARITRNIRKLVRAEIARALAAEQLY